jgi:hypothetical protein
MVVLVSGAIAGTPGATVGLLSKVIAVVSHKVVDKEWQAAKRGETLGAGDMVRTGEKSIAIIKFLDNSLVRVRELTEVTVKGVMNGSNFSKSVDVRMGVIGFTVQKQRVGEEFRFTSPTSVASIRGTGGSLRITGAGDTLIVLEGSVNLQNLHSGQTTAVGAGFTGISSPDGSVVVRQSTPAERLRAEEALLGEAQKMLEFELRDNQGRSKRLHLEYRE